MFRNIPQTGTTTTPTPNPAEDEDEPQLGGSLLNDPLLPDIQLQALDGQHQCPLCLKSGLNPEEARKVCADFFAWIRHAHPKYDVDHYMYGTPTGSV